MLIKELLILPQNKQINRISLVVKTTYNEATRLAT
jgi:hypothetical protein